MHEKAYEIAFAALDGMALADLYQLNASFSFQSSAVSELIEEYDHEHYLASVQRWLDSEVSDDMYLDQSPEEVRDEWKAGIAKAAVDIISWPYLKYHRNYQEPSGNYIEPTGIPEGFPDSIYATVAEKNQNRLTTSCLNVIQAIKIFEENEAKVRLILSSLGQ